MEYSGKTVVITGGASGLGYLSGKNYAERGANVVLFDVNKEALDVKVDKLCAGIPVGTYEDDDARAHVVGFEIDVRNYDQIKAAMTTAAKKFGTLDIMINCAGGAEMRVLKKSGEFKDVPIDVFDWSIDVNLKGQLYCDHAILHYMAEQMGGVIINIGSVTGEEGCMSNIGYATSKSAAMGGLTKSLAKYGAQYGVRVCCVSPGPVLTRAAMSSMKTLMNRAAEPQEIVDMFLYLTSDKASFITGVNYFVDGGRNIMDRGRS